MRKLITYPNRVYISFHTVHLVQYRVCTEYSCQFGFEFLLNTAALPIELGLGMVATLIQFHATSVQNIFPMT